MILNPVCLVCRHALDVWVDRPTGQVTYKHTLAYQGPMHEPQPAPLAEFEEVVLICDFCSNSNPIWNYACPDIVDTFPDRDQEFHMGTEWAVCGACAKFIEKKALEHLLSRVVKAMAFKWASETSMKIPLRPIYRQFLSSYTGRERIT